MLDLTIKIWKSYDTNHSYTAKKWGTMNIVMLGMTMYNKYYGDRTDISMQMFSLFSHFGLRFQSVLRRHFFFLFLHTFSFPFVAVGCGPTITAKAAAICGPDGACTSADQGFETPALDREVNWEYTVVSRETNNQ